MDKFSYIPLTTVGSLSGKKRWGRLSNQCNPNQLCESEIGEKGEGRDAVLRCKREISSMFCATFYPVLN